RNPARRDLRLASAIGRDRLGPWLSRSWWASGPELRGGYGLRTTRPESAVGDHDALGPGEHRAVRSLTVLAPRPAATPRRADRGEGLVREALDSSHVPGRAAGHLQRR